MAEFYHKNLTEEEVYDIVDRYFEGSTQQSLADEYEVSLKEIYNIVYGKIYKQYDVKSRYPDYQERLDTRKKRAGK